VPGNRRRNVTKYVGSLLAAFSDAGSTPAASTKCFVVNSLTAHQRVGPADFNPDKINQIQSAVVRLMISRLPQKCFSISRDPTTHRSQQTPMTMPETVAGM